MFISHEHTLPSCHIFLAFSHLFECVLSMQNLELDIFCDPHFLHLDISDIMIQIILNTGEGTDHGRKCRNISSVHLIEDNLILQSRNENRKYFPPPIPVPQSYSKLCSSRPLAVSFLSFLSQYPVYHTDFLWTSTSSSHNT